MAQSCDDAGGAAAEAGSFEATLESYTVSSGGPLQSYTANLLQEIEAANQEPQQAEAEAGGESSATPAAKEAAEEEEEEELRDPNCDPSSPQIVRFEDVSAAAYKIRHGVVRTPCDRSRMSRLTGMDIHFKKELLQYTGSFKERGARFTLLSLSPEQKRLGVVAASAGNHALALAYHGQELSIPIVVVMPTIAPLMKINACVQYGARVIIMGNHIGESKEVALRIAKAENLLYINGYDHPHILAGQGTVGLEIVEQMDKVDAVVVPVGGGGLIAGIALAVKAISPGTLIIGAESERCPSFTEALRAGSPQRVAVRSSLADGLAVPCVGSNAFYSCRHLVDKMVTVSEEFIALAILRLVELEKTVVEGAGATGLAAILQGLLPQLQGKTVAVPLCGGNIDTTVLGRVIERGLAVDGRLINFVTTVSDRPGGIAELSALMAGMGVSIKDIFHERAWLKTDIFQVRVRCACEVRDKDHKEELLAKLQEKYGNVQLC